MCGSGGVVLGPVDLALACAAHVLGDADLADERVDRALASAERMRSDPWIARCLEQRHRQQRVEADRVAALELARTLGMRPMVDRLERAAPQ